MAKIYDISVVLGEQDITYPGDPAFRREKPTAAAKEPVQLTMSLHSGTHLDAPAHFFPQGRRLDDFAPADFLLPAHVVEIFHPEIILAEDIEDMPGAPGEAVLFRTGNSHAGRAISGQFSARYVHLSPGAAELCVARQLKLVGLDYISVDPYGAPEAPAHQILLGAGLLILEGINLADVRPGDYLLLCLPLRIKEAEAAPARALLLEDEAELPFRRQTPPPR